MSMTCLDLVQEAAVRIGIVPPSTIENVSNPDPSKRDPDAMILLGALNQTMRQALVKNLFDPFSIMAEIDLPKIEAGNTFSFSIIESFSGFGGLLSSYFELRYNDGSLQTFFETDPDTFLKYWQTPGYTSKPVPNKNMFRIYSNAVWFISKEVFTADKYFTSIRFSYRSTYGVMSATSIPAASFEHDDDTTSIDDELLISGTVLNYKAYQGMEFQFDSVNYNEYLQSLERNRQRNNLIKDRSMQQGVGVSE